MEFAGGRARDDPPKFLRALLDKDDGRLLAFFFTLGQLDLQHQRFFTLSAKAPGAVL